MNVGSITTNNPIGYIAVESIHDVFLVCFYARHMKAPPFLSKGNHAFTSYIFDKNCHILILTKKRFLV